MTPYWKKGLYHTTIDGTGRCHTSDMGTWDDAIAEAGRWAGGLGDCVHGKEVACTTYLLPVGAGFRAGDDAPVPQDMLKRCHQAKFIVLAGTVQLAREGACRANPASGPKPDRGSGGAVPE